MVKRLHDTPQNIIAQIVKAECVMSGYNPDEFRLWYRHSHMQEARARVVKAALEMGITVVQVARYFQCETKEVKEAILHCVIVKEAPQIEHRLVNMVKAFWRPAQRKFSELTLGEYKDRAGYGAYEAQREGLARVCNSNGEIRCQHVFISDKGRELAATLGMVAK